jgi:hypothetical protein
MSIDMVRKGARWNWEDIIMTRVLPIFGGLLVLSLIVFGIVATVSANNNSAKREEQRATEWNATQSLIDKFKGKRVVVEGFDTEGLVTGGHGTELHIYFPEVGDIHLEEDFLRVVGEVDK